MNSGYWEDLTTTDLDGMDPEITLALLPLAAVEQHGPHLPLGTDAMIAEALVAALLERPPDGVHVLALPLQRLGHSPEHHGYAGTLTIAHEPLLAVWESIAAGVAAVGLRKLILLNTHGGQTALVDLAAVRLRAHLGMMVARVNYGRLGLPEGLFDDDEIAHGLHGGEVETSLMLHLRPELVRREALSDVSGLPAQLAARHTLLGVERPVGIGWLASDLDASGISGNAARADAARGGEALRHLTLRLRTLCAEIATTPLSLLDRAPDAREDRQGDAG